jgi:hypothetical protein
MGNQKDMPAALEASGWHVADTGNTNAVLHGRSQTGNRQEDLSMAVSTLLLLGRSKISATNGRAHRGGHEPTTWNRKRSLGWRWARTGSVCPGRKGTSVTRQIDPAVDGERDNVAGSLPQK